MLGHSCLGANGLGDLCIALFMVLYHSVENLYSQANANDFRHMRLHVLVQQMSVMGTCVVQDTWNKVHIYRGGTESIFLPDNHWICMVDA